MASYPRKRVNISIGRNDADRYLVQRAAYIAKATGLSISHLAKLGLRAIVEDPTLIQEQITGE